MLAEKIASVKIDGSLFTFPSERNTAGALTVTEQYRECPAESTLYDWTYFFENRSDRATGMITELYGLDYTFPLDADETLTMNTLRGDDWTALSFRNERYTIGVGDTVERHPIGGRPSDTTAFPYFDLSWNGGSVIVGLGWSGYWKLTVSRDEKGVHLTAGQGDCHMVLQPGEHIRSIRVLLMKDTCDALTLRHRFVEAQRRFASPLTMLGQDFAAPITVHCFDRYFWDSDDEAATGKAPYFETEEAQIKLCENAGKCGTFDIHWLDACWFKDTFRSGVGNYTEMSVGFPNGLKPVADAAHRNGLQFLVWFEPMRANVGTEICRVFGDDPRKLIRNSETDYLVHLGDDTVLQWVYEKIADTMEKFEIDAFREDFNIDPLPCLRSIEAPDRVGYEQIKFTEGLYQLWDKLRERFPGLFIDNCAGGGRNLDAESCARTYILWHSDTGCHEYIDGVPISLWHQNENRNLSQYLPLHQTACYTYDAYSIRSSMTGGLNCEFEMLDDTFDVEKIRLALREVRECGRYWKGDFTALTEPSLDWKDYCAYTLRLPKTDEGLIVAIRRKDAPERFTAKIGGLAPDKTYRLTFSDEQYRITEGFATGAEMAEGLVLTVPQAPGSVVVRYAPKED